MGFFTFTWTILRQLFQKPFTVLYPAEKKALPKGLRGHIEIEISQCIFCGMCVRKCPSQALSVTREAKVWEIERLRCVNCNYCVEVCPKKCLRMEPEWSKVTGEKGKETHRA